MSFLTAAELGIGSPPSTLADVLRQVDDALRAMADATPLLVGKHYLTHFGVGSPPRIVAVPDLRGKLTDPTEMGNVASVIHSCDMHVRAAETGDDITRFANAYALADLAVDLVSTAASGRVVFTDYVDDSPSGVDGGAGAGIKFSFTFQRDIMHNATRWALPPAADNTLAAVPVPPPGIIATGATINTTVTPES